MSLRIRRTVRAQADIRSISRWIARDSVDAALKWLNDLDAQLQRLADAPGSGTDRGDLRPGMRSSPFGNYLIFFKRTAGAIQILRVIHGARNYRRLFE